MTFISHLPVIYTLCMLGYFGVSIKHQTLNMDYRIFNVHMLILFAHLYTQGTVTCLVTHLPWESRPSSTSENSQGRRSRARYVMVTHPIWWQCSVRPVFREPVFLLCSPNSSPVILTPRIQALFLAHPTLGKWWQHAHKRFPLPQLYPAETLLSLCLSHTHTHTATTLLSKDTVSLSHTHKQQQQNQ